MNLLLVPVTIGLAAAAPVVLWVWAPQSFDPLGLTWIVGLVAVCTFPYGQFLANMRALMSEGRTGRAAVTTLIAALVNIGLNVALVPLLGIAGSALATILSYALLAWLTRPSASSGLDVPGVPSLLGLLIGAGVAATLLMAALPATHVWLVVRLVVCAAAVCGFFFVLRLSGVIPRYGVQAVGRHRR